MSDTKNKLESNLWKYFLMIITDRRNYWPIIAIYFLTLPNATAQQIGLYTAIGWIVGFIVEIPSGYVSDRFGHKRTLIISKCCFILSTLLFLYANSVVFFIIGASVMAIGFAFTSGTKDAFLHNTLLGLKKDSQFAKISGKVNANASLFSIFIIVLLPLTTVFSITTPLIIHLGIDFIGLFVALLLYSPKVKYSSEDTINESLKSQLQRFRGTGFYVTSLLIAFLSLAIMVTTKFKEPFVESLGFPIVFIGSIMGFSRFVWFVVGHNLHYFRKLQFRHMILCEWVLFSVILLTISQLTHPYILAFLFALFIGYYRGREPIIKEYFLDNFLQNKRYKATLLSIKSQIALLIQSVAIYVFAFYMDISYGTGFFALAMFVIISVPIVYFFLPTRKSS